MLCFERRVENRSFFDYYGEGGCEYKNIPNRYGKRCFYHATVFVIVSINEGQMNTFSGGALNINAKNFTVSHRILRMSNRYRKSQI